MVVREQRVTSVDVAREAGVSVATVSYVLNKVTHQKISEETRLRVLAAVEKLGYTPSAAARNLRRGRNDIVLLLLKNVPPGSTMSQLMEHLTDDLERHGLTLVTRLERDRPIAELWRELTPASVIFFTSVGEEDRAQMSAAGAHVTHYWLDGSGHDAITLSQTRVGGLQVEHLAATGHRVLGYAAPVDSRLAEFYDLRLEGVRRACAERGLPPPDIRELPADTELAAEVARAWRAAGVTAVCAFNDEVAFALLAGMREAGLAAPDDLAVIGVDDIPLARFACPPLTTINQDMRALAADLAVQVLSGLGRRRGRRPKNERKMGVVVRGSA